MVARTRSVVLKIRQLGVPRSLIPVFDQRTPNTSSRWCNLPLIANHPPLFVIFVSSKSLTLASVDCVILPTRRHVFGYIGSAVDLSIRSASDGCHHLQPPEVNYRDVLRVRVRIAIVDGLYEIRSRRIRIGSSPAYVY